MPKCGFNKVAKQLWLGGYFWVAASVVWAKYRNKCRFPEDIHLLHIEFKLLPYGLW